MKKLRIVLGLCILTVGVVSATTVSEQLTRCGVCGADVKIHKVMSTSSFGQMDLDTRPAPMRRYLYSHRLGFCKACGYCSDNLSETITNANVRAFLKTLDLGKMGKSLMLRYEVAAKLSELQKMQAVKIFSYWQRAYWAADDESDKAGIRRNRLKAADVLEEVCRNNFVDGDLLMLSDIYRVAGEFDKAEKTLIRLIKKDKLAELIEINALYEMRLVKEKNSSVKQIVNK